MKIRLTIFCFLFTPLIFAQTNLVPNPSFEEYNNCPDALDEINHAIGWYSCGGTPDYFNSCDTTGYMDFSVPTNGFGYQIAADGNAYSGLYSLVYSGTVTPYKEYIGCKLNGPLIIGQKYFVSFKTSSSRGFSINGSTNNLGLLFSMVSFQTPDPYTVWGIPTNNFAHVRDTNVITDSVNWTTIKGTVIADSAYQYLLIGVFFDTTHIDTVLHYYNSTLYKAYYYVDMVCVSTDSLTCYSPNSIIENTLLNKISIFPNPATNELTIDLTIPDKYVFKLYDLLGAKRLSVRLDKSSKTVDLTGIDSGVYVYTIVDNKGDKIKTDKLIIIK